jgi:putative ABC transport system ATP-binding protein
MISNMEPALQITDLHFARPDGFSMRIPEFSLAADEQVLLAGSSGCGKSTLLLLAAGLLDAASGEILLSGRSITAARGGRRDAIRADRVGMVFQTHHLLPGFTARENVSAPLLFGGVRPGQHAAIADALLGRLGISDPTTRVDRLSVGQQQRVAIARALVGNPSVVFADEPTAALDPENAVKAVELLKDVCRECNAALLLTSHDPGLEAAFSRVVRFTELAGTSEVVG